MLHSNKALKFGLLIMKNNNKANDKDYENHKKNAFEGSLKYFEIQAKQRIDFFKCYILFLSLYVGGVGFLLTKCRLPIETSNLYIIAISFAFILITIVFWLIDRRNHHLIKMAKASLADLETVKSTNHKCYGIFTKLVEDSKFYCLISHSFCFNVLYFIAIIIAVMLMAISICHSLSRNQSCTTCGNNDTCTVSIPKENKPSQSG